MPTITALLHTENDSLRLGRCLETLYPCDEIVIVDHGSRDATVQIAQEYGARVVTALPGTGFDFNPKYLGLDRGDAARWVFSLDPREALSESLAASLFELKLDENGTAVALPAFSVLLREEGENGWVENSEPQTRLVPWGWSLWQGRFPNNAARSKTLAGYLLRFAFP